MQTQGWTSVFRQKVLILVEAASKNSDAQVKLDALISVLDSYRSSGSPSVIKLLSDADKALL